VDLLVNELINAPSRGNADVSYRHQTGMWQSHSSRLKLFNDRWIIMSAIVKNITRHTWHQDLIFLTLNIRKAIINLS
jgi:hypothetical protein